MPVLYSLDDPLCETSCLQKLLACWQQVGMPVWAQAWKTSRHMSHLHQRNWKYHHSLITFLGRCPHPPMACLMGLWVPVHHQDWGQLPSGQGTETGWQRHRDLLVYSDYSIYNDITVTQSVQS